MKRLTVRLTALSVVVVLGLIAIAQARYGKTADSQEPPTGVQEATPGSLEESADEPRSLSREPGAPQPLEVEPQEPLKRPAQGIATSRRRTRTPDEPRPTIDPVAAADRSQLGRQLLDHAALPRARQRGPEDDPEGPVDQAPQAAPLHDPRARLDRPSAPLTTPPTAPPEAAPNDDPEQLRPAPDAGQPLDLAAQEAQEMGPRYAPAAAEPPDLTPASDARPLLDSSANQSEPHVPRHQSAEGSGLPGPPTLEGTQSPSLTLQKVAPDEIQVGKECAFQIKVRNTGHVAAHAVCVSDQIPQKTRLVGSQPSASQTAAGQLVWELGTLEAGAEATVEMQLMPTAEGEVGSVAAVHFEAHASVRTVATKPELALRLSGPPTVMIGDDVPIKIEISNPGSGIATGVILLEDVPPGLSHPAGQRLEFELGTLAPGESRDLELVLTAEQAGMITNALTARGDASLSVQASVDLEVIAPQLQVAIDGPKRRFLERQATYTLSLDNPGTAAAKDVQLAAYLPKGMKFVRADNHGHYDPSTHSVVWGLDELPAKAHGSVQLVAMPVEAGSQTLRAEGKAAQGLGDEAKQDISVEGVAAIMFEVVDLEDPIEVGGETTYEIRVVNQGSKTATQVQVVVDIPPDMKPASASGPTEHSIEAGRVVFAPLRRLAPKADTTYRLQVEGLAPGDQRLRVQLVTDEVRMPVTKEVSTHVFADE